MPTRLRSPACSIPVAVSLLLAAGCAPPAGMSAPAPSPGQNAVPAAAQGAVPSAAQSAAPQPTTITGTVTLAQPLLGARVMVVSLEDNALVSPESFKTSTTDGSFTIQVTDLPANFRLEITEGTVAGQPFSSVLEREVRGFTPGSGPLNVDLATTMAAEYAQAHPNREVAFAEQAVKKYLGIPAGVALGTTEVSKYFDAASFMVAVDEFDGVDALMDESINQIDEDMIHPYPPANAPAALFRLQQIAIGDAAKWLGGNVASGAVGAIGGLAMNQFLLAVGVPGDPALAAINAKLDALLDKVNKLDSRVTDLNRQLSAAISQTTFQATNNARMVPIIDSLRAVDLKVATVSKRQKELLDEKDATKVAERQAALKAAQKAVLDKIKEKFGDSEEALESFHAALVGVGGNSLGVIQCWMQVVEKTYPRYYNQDAAHAMGDQWAYWNALQAKLVLYLASAADATPDASMTGKEILARWQNNRATQLKMLRGMPASAHHDSLDLTSAGLPKLEMFVNALPAETLYDRQARRLWTRGPQAWTTWDWSHVAFGTARGIAQRATGLRGWRVPEPDEFFEVRKDNGKTITFQQAGFLPELDAHTRVFFTAQRWQADGWWHWPANGNFLQKSEAGKATSVTWKRREVQSYVQIWDGEMRYLDGDVPWRPDWIHPDHWRYGMMVMCVHTVEDPENARYVYQ